MHSGKNFNWDVILYNKHLLNICYVPWTLPCSGGTKMTAPPCPWPLVLIFQGVSAEDKTMSSCSSMWQLQKLRIVQVSWTLKRDVSPRLRVLLSWGERLSIIWPFLCLFCFIPCKVPKWTPDFSCSKSFVALQLTPHLSCLHPFSHTVGLACFFHSHTPSFWATYWMACLLQ